MNLLLLKANQVTGNCAVVSGRQLEHLLTVQRSQVGDSIRVGLLDGLMGQGIIKTMDANQSSIEIVLETQAPEPLPLILVLALPRPKMLRRSLQTIAAMGVKTVYLVNSSRVEKSFWQTPLLKPEALEEQLILGLEQARDTIIPEVHLRKLFKPFVEDELGDIIANTNALVAHPIASIRCPVDSKEPISLAIGPEGGFIPYEIDKLNEVGFKTVHLGQRILRVETAIPALISRLFPS
ncbi:MAG: 16S rRNA (uracil(1498)-N(3))-methyltransferase [Porticoccaceae bacterium]|jgi:16S rRNA (uracil1498-N3)-methyltransferase|nr:16S rRNA (uracil(1498)-N(3))-methyltransferase [Porticoccaceae bacterium]MDG1311871.1 16S rRNA (uracil(1498)-N(3))-methyltransferase [Porticoccaceae bacterium]